MEGAVQGGAIQSSPSNTNSSLNTAVTAPSLQAPVSPTVSGIDITERILASAKVTAKGLDVSEVNLPKGNHSLALEIKDSMGRVGQQDIRFVVE